MNLETTVEAIEVETREVDLRGPDGEFITLTVPDSATRFSDIEVGDVLRVEYLLYLSADFRKPTEEELANPIKIETEAIKAEDDQAPMGAVGTVIESLVTIELLDRIDMLVVVKGPEGNYVTIPVTDPTILSEVSIGQQFFLTYAEGVALAVEKLNTEIPE